MESHAGVGVLLERDNELPLASSRVGTRQRVDEECGLCRPGCVGDRLAGVFDLHIAIVVKTVCNYDLICSMNRSCLSGGKGSIGSTGWVRVVGGRRLSAISSLMFR